MILPVNLIIKAFNVAKKQNILIVLNRSQDLHEKVLVCNTNGIALHLGLRAKPFEKLKNLHLIFEFAPLVDVSNGDFGGFLRTQFGVSYAMSKKKKD